MGALADVQPTFDVDAVADESVDLGKQRFRVEHHAIAERATHAFVEDAAGDLVEDEAHVAQVDRVACVRAALVPDDPVRALGEDIDELAFPLVAPLGSDDDDGTIAFSEHDWRIRRAKKYAPAAHAGR